MNKSSLFSAWQCIPEVSRWHEAIRIACHPLYQQNIINNLYSEAIIGMTEKTGCWYILSPGFALPHARPQQGVISHTSHLSLLKLLKNCQFPGKEKVNLIIVLAAADSHQHITKIQQLTNWLDDNNRLQRLLSCSCTNALSLILQEDHNNIIENA